MPFFHRPKGLIIYKPIPDPRRPFTWLPDMQFCLKSCGRTGAVIRSRFQQLSRVRQQQILEDWAKGHYSQF